VIKSVRKADLPFLDIKTREIKDISDLKRPLGILGEAERGKQMMRGLEIAR
jgi:hypothetical protein